MVGNEILVVAHLLFVIGLATLSETTRFKCLHDLPFFFLMVSNLFIYKEMNVFGLCVTTCDIYTVGCVLSLNLIQEKYGKEKSRECLYKSILLLLIFLVMAKFQVWYHPSQNSLPQSDAYSFILQHSVRVVGASLIVTLVCDRFDIFWFNYLKKRFPSKGFSFRFTLSTLVSQFFDTLLFSFLALYGIASHLFHCLLVAYLAKITCIFVGGAIFSFLPKKFYGKSL